MNNECVLHIIRNFLKEMVEKKANLSLNQFILKDGCFNIKENPGLRVLQGQVENLSFPQK